MYVHAYTQKKYTDYKNDGALQRPPVKNTEVLYNRIASVILLSGKLRKWILSGKAATKPENTPKLFRSFQYFCIYFDCHIPFSTTCKQKKSQR